MKSVLEMGWIAARANHPQAGEEFPESELRELVAKLPLVVKKHCEIVARWAWSRRDQDVREMAEAAEKYRDEDFKQNPNGYYVAPWVNRETTSNAVEAGWNAARATPDPKVVALIEAASNLDCLCSVAEKLSGHRVECRIYELHQALAAFDGRNDKNE